MNPEEDLRPYQCIFCDELKPCAWVSYVCEAHHTHIKLACVNCISVRIIVSPMSVLMPLEMMMTRELIEMTVQMIKN